MKRKILLKIRLGRAKGRNPGKGRYCTKHSRWTINVAGKLNCIECHRSKVERRRLAEKMAEK